MFRVPLLDGALAFEIAVGDDDNTKELAALDERVDVRIIGVGQAGVHVLHFEPGLVEEGPLPSKGLDVAFEDDVVGTEGHDWVKVWLREIRAQTTMRCDTRVLLGTL